MLAYYVQRTGRGGGISLQRPAVWSSIQSDVQSSPRSRGEEVDRGGDTRTRGCSTSWLNRLPDPQQFEDPAQDKQFKDVLLLDTVQSL